MTGLSLRLFGHSWLAFRVFPLLQVALYSAGLYLIVQYTSWTDGRRALLIVSVFGLTITIYYYRFDDFHVTTQVLQVYSIWLLLRLCRSPAGQLAWRTALPLGLLAGISIANRLNDGAALLAASAIALCGIANQQRLRAMFCFLLAAVAGFCAIVLTTGDTLRDWYTYTVVEAAKIKGGSGHILTYPLTLPARTAMMLASDPHKLLVYTYPVCAAACVLALPWVLQRFRGMRRAALTVFVAAVFLFSMLHYWRSVAQEIWLPMLAKLGVPLAYSIFLLIFESAARAWRKHGEGSWNGSVLLLLVPTFQLFLAAVTGGSGIVETTPAMALTLLLLPVVYPDKFQPAFQNAYLVLLVLLSFPSFRDKVSSPFHWHHFYNEAMYQDRIWYHHPVYGPMYIDTRQLQFILPVCSTIMKNPGTGLLSAPYPNANYFCNIPPWHGYVQTWYDTSSRGTIEQLVRELNVAPPTWVFYERSLPSLYAHELVYANGGALPHRALDGLIVQRILSQQWTIKYQRCFGGADWMLIRTSPPQKGEQSVGPVVMTNTLTLCNFTQF